MINYSKANMHFKSNLIALLSVTILSLAGDWEPVITPNVQLQVNDLGVVASEDYDVSFPAKSAGGCAMSAQENEYGCAWFESHGVMGLRVIYQCEDGDWVFRQLCEEGTKYSRCVKNEGPGWPRYFPAVPGSKVVCRRDTDVETRLNADARTDFEPL